MTGVFDDHLSLDAVVAYADGEMGLTAYQRAAAHLSRCASCAADVAEQTAASQYLREARLPAMPGSLFDALRSIPIALPAAVGHLGQSVSGNSARDGRPPQDGPRQNGHRQDGPRQTGHRQDGPRQTGPQQDGPQAAGWTRRFRWGAGALMAGIAAGAVMAGAAGDQPADHGGRPVTPETSAVSNPGGPGSAPSGPTAVLRTTVIDVRAGTSASSSSTR